MSDIDQFKGTPFDERNTGIIPGSLKTLTVLTFIGCGIGLLGTLYNIISGKKNLDTMEKMQGSEQLEKMPDFLKKMYTPEAVELTRIGYENRIPLTIISLVAIALCLYGAIQMRALKKQGYSLWLIGELLPIIGTVIFIGTAAFSNFSGIILLSIVALFVLLYSLQLKYLR